MRLRVPSHRRVGVPAASQLDVADLPALTERQVSGAAMAEDMWRPNCFRLQTETQEGAAPMFTKLVGCEVEDQVRCGLAAH